MYECVAIGGWWVCGVCERVCLVGANICIGDESARVLAVANAEREGGPLLLVDLHILRRVRARPGLLRRVAGHLIAPRHAVLWRCLLV